MYIPALPILLTLCVITVLGLSQGEVLVFGGLRGKTTPGLWGGEVDRNNGTGDKGDLFTSGYSCALWNNAGVTYLVKDTLVLSASYDKHTTDFLLQLNSTINDTGTNISPWQRVTLAAGPLCTNAGEITTACSRPVPLLLWNAVSSAGEAGPFAWYNREMYFVLTRWEQVEVTFEGFSHLNYHQDNGTSGGGFVNRTWIELRKSETCQESFPFQRGNFDLAHCSALIAVLFDSLKDLSFHTEEEEMLPGRHLLLVPTAIGRFAFVVLFRIPKKATVGDIRSEAMLVEVAMASYKNPTSKVAVRHMSTLENVHPVTSEVFRHVAGSGGIDHLENQVCWSTLEQVRCAWWDPESFRNVQQVADNKESIAVQHCVHGSTDGGPLFAGVAIATTDHPFNPGNLSLYITCQSSGNPEVGVALLYHVINGSHLAVVVTSQATPINARSIFLAARAREACPTLTPPTGGGGTDGNNGGGANVKGAASTSTVSAVTAGVGLLSCLNLWKYRIG